jgi:hypothetical protein
MMHEPVKALKPLPMLDLPKIPGRGRQQTLQEWHAAGGSVPVQYKSRPHVWHAKVKKYAEGGTVGGEAYGNAPDSSDSGSVQSEQHFQVGGIAKLLKAAKPMIKAASEVLPAAEREANLAKFLQDSHEQRRLYHATPSDFKEFQGKGFDPKISGNATWLTPNAKLQPAAHNTSSRRDVFREGTNVMPVHVQAKRPLVLDDSTMEEWAKEVFAGGSPQFPFLLHPDWEKAIKAEGYDSIFHPRSGEVIMLDPKKIKSAIGNRGTYDVTDPDITKKAGGAIHMAGGGDPRGEIRPTPRNKMLGMAADAAKGLHHFASEPFGYGNPPGEMLSEMLGVNALGKVLDKLSYGEPITNYGKANVPFLPEDTGELAMALGPLAPAGARLAAKGAKAAGRGALDLAKSEGARNVVEKVMASPLMAPSRQMNVVKQPGGNFLTGKVEEDIKYLKSPHLDERTEELVDLRRRFGDLPAYDRSEKTLAAESALNNWVDSNLTKYIKNEMGSPKDTVRQLFDQKALDIEAKYAKDVERADRTAQRAADEPDPQRKANLERESRRLSTKALADRKLAEEHITHRKGIEEDNNYFASSLGRRRMDAGFPEYGLAESQAGKAWEQASDQGLDIRNAGNIQRATEQQRIEKELEQNYLEAQKNLNEKFNEHIIKNGNLTEGEMYALNYKTPYPVKARAVGDTEYKATRKKLDDFRVTFSNEDAILAKENPWINKVDPNSSVYSTFTDALGFDHILDVLKADMAAGRIRPEQLNKMSMEQAVRRTAEYDLDAAKVAAAARAKSLEGMPVHKEYPEGYKWVQLDQPGQFAQESDVMGHSVRGYEPPRGHAEHIPESGTEGSDYYGHGGYEAIKSGRAKIYSLRDPEGMSHATVEVGQADPSQAYIEQQPKKVQNEFKKRFDDWVYSIDYRPSPEQIRSQTQYLFDDMGISTPNKITQIKGKGNAAPKEEYLPYVQDLVKSGNWSDVGDLGNTGLLSSKNIVDRPPENFSMARNVRQEAVDRAWRAKDFPDYMTKAEYEAMLLKHAPEEWVAKKAQRAAEDDELLRQLRPPEEGMAHGGEVHMQAGGLAKLAVKKSAAKAAKGLAEAPKGVEPIVVKKAPEPPLARAPAKSKQEIEAIAERIAPQVLGEFVRGKGGQSVAGKTQKQFQREKDLPVDVRPTKGEEIAPPKSIDYEKLKGNVFVGIPGDTSITGKSIHSVGDINMESPSPQHGGPLYGHGREDEQFWASGLSPGSRVHKLGKTASEQYDAPVLGKYLSMGPEGMYYAQHLADANLQAIDLSKMTSKQIEGMNELLRKGSPASGPRPAFPGIEDKNEAYLNFAFDPKLRVYFNQLMEMPTVTKEFNLPSGQDIRFAATEPELRNLEQGMTGKAIGEMRPGAKELKLSSHPTYSHDIPGKFLGSGSYPVPYELSFPDTLRAIRQDPKQAPYEFGSLKMIGPRQIIDQQFIDEMKQYEEAMKKLTGKKRGGAVRGGLSSLKKKQSSRSNTAKEA